MLILHLHIFLLSITLLKGINWESLDFPSQHVPYYFYTFQNIKEQCSVSSDCPFKKRLTDGLCWGYEEGCQRSEWYSNAICTEHHKGWTSTKKDQFSQFFDAADFGYVREFRDQLQVICEETQPGDSLLECSENLQFCRGKNVMIDFKNVPNRPFPVRYDKEVLRQGDIGGKCRLNKNLLESNLRFISPLQSWGPELRFFEEIPTKVSRSNPACDVWVDKPAIVTKIDATVNMYHHFCDFFNLYASQHVNNSSPYSFSTDNQVLIWESSSDRSNFEISWKAFTKNPRWSLGDVSGKKVCFRDIMFPLLPRMVFGLYYNSPIVRGCKNSGLFHAFSHHFLHRLRVPAREVPQSDPDKLHVTFMSRKTTHRRVLNEETLITALRNTGKFIVRQVTYSHSESFSEQLKQDQWTDLLIGMHGAGLTHLLFLPDWAAVIELYNCGDPGCYYDLARLRGVDYFTWQQQDKVFPHRDQSSKSELNAHEKFINYSFDETEFVSLVQKAAQSVRKNIAEMNNKTSKRKEEL